MPGGIKIGIIGRGDNTGLGVETWEFARHIPCKVMIVSLEELGPQYRIYPERFDNPTIIEGYPLDEHIADFIKDIDLLFFIETPYNDHTVEIARKQGVKTVMRVNYEWLVDYYPDCYVVPSLYGYDQIPGPKVYLPFPINREVLPYKLRKKATKFIHIAGNMKAALDRNGTRLLLESLQYIKSDIELVIKSQVPLNCNDSRVRVDVCDQKNYWDIWEDADVYISPRRYAGQSLPLNEAMSLGLAIIMTDMEPQNQFLPKDLLIPIIGVRPMRIKKTIPFAEIDPIDIAKRVDQVAGQDIKKYSKISDNIAQAWSWETLKPKYLRLFKHICCSPSKTSNNTTK
jgi:hypothetical protein